MNTETYTENIRAIRASVEKGHLVPIEIIMARYSEEYCENYTVEVLTRIITSFIKMEIAGLERYMNGELVC